MPGERMPSDGGDPFENWFLFVCALIGLPVGWWLGEIAGGSFATKVLLSVTLVVILITIGILLVTWISFDSSWAKIATSEDALGLSDFS